MLPFRNKRKDQYTVVPGIGDGQDTSPKTPPLKPVRTSSLKEKLQPRDNISDDVMLHVSSGQFLSTPEPDDDTWNLPFIDASRQSLDHLDETTPVVHKKDGVTNNGFQHRTPSDISVPMLVTDIDRSTDEVCLDLENEPFSVEEDINGTNINSTGNGIIYPTADAEVSDLQHDEKDEPNILYNRTNKNLSIIPEDEAELKPLLDELTPNTATETENEENDSVSLEDGISINSSDINNTDVLVENSAAEGEEKCDNELDTCSIASDSEVFQDEKDFDTIRRTRVSACGDPQEFVDKIFRMSLSGEPDSD